MALDYVHAIEDPAPTPAGHGSSHQSGGTDAIKLDDLAAPDDNTDLNASTAKHGLLLKLDNDTSHFLRGDGTWAAIPTSTNYAPASVSNEAAGSVTGAYTDLATVGNGEVLVAEVAADPGFDIRIGFTGVSTFNRLITRTKYEGALAHDIQIALYDYNHDEWDLVDTIHLQNDYIQAEYEIASDTDYIDAGAVLMRFYHVGTGNASHDVHIDFIRLRDEVGG